MEDRTINAIAGGEPDPADKPPTVIMHYGHRYMLVADHDAYVKQHQEYVRRLDVALNGDGAAKQASIIDLVAQFEFAHHMKR